MNYSSLESPWWGESNGSYFISSALILTEIWSFKVFDYFIICNFGQFLGWDIGRDMSGTLKFWWDTSHVQHWLQQLMNLRKHRRNYQALFIQPTTESSDTESQPGTGPLNMNIFYIVNSVWESVKVYSKILLKCTTSAKNFLYCTINV